MKIMVIDDEVSILNIVSHFLSMKQIETISISDPSKVLEYLQEDKIDLIITDIFMGPPTGRELIEMLNIAYPGIPVIVMSAFLTPQIKRELEKDFKVKDFLAKPFSFEDLENIIVRYSN